MNVEQMLKDLEEEAKGMRFVIAETSRLNEYQKTLNTGEKLLLGAVLESIANEFKNDSIAPGGLNIIYLSLRERIENLETQISNLAALIADK